jgi:hypothetical protein
MKELPHSCREKALILESFWERRPVCTNLAEVVLKVPSASTIRPSSRHEAVSGGSAPGEIRKCTGEYNSLLCNTIIISSIGIENANRT